MNRDQYGARTAAIEGVITSRRTTEVECESAADAVLLEQLGGDGLLVSCEIVVAKLRSAGAHSPSCSARDPDGDGACSCGRDEAVNEAAEILNRIERLRGTLVASGRYPMNPLDCNCEFVHKSCPTCPSRAKSYGAFPDEVATR